MLQEIGVEHARKETQAYFVCHFYTKRKIASDKLPLMLFKPRLIFLTLVNANRCDRLVRKSKERRKLSSFSSTSAVTAIKIRLFLDSFSVFGAALKNCMTKVAQLNMIEKLICLRLQLARNVETRATRTMWGGVGNTADIVDVV